MTTAEQVKREFPKPRLLALAVEENLAVAGEGRLQCPHRCSDDKRAASVSDDPAGHAVWHCQRCGAGGTALDLVMATRGLDLPDAVAHLAGRVPHLAALPTKKKLTRPPAAELWRALEPADADGLAYLRSRGLEAAAAQGSVRFSTGTSSYPWLNHRAIDGFRVVMPLWTPRGDLAQLHLRNIHPAERIPLNETTGKPWASKIQLPKVDEQPELVLGAVGPARTAARVFLAEGMADTLALTIAGVCVLGAPGTDQVKKLPAFLGDVIGRAIILCAQNDAARVAAGAKVKLTSEDAFLTIEQQLAAAGAEVMRLVTPKPHKDPAEWLKAIGTQAFRAEIDKLQPQQEDHHQPQAIGSGALKVLQMPARDPRPRIIVSTEEHEVNDQAITALADDPVIFQRDGMLVHVVRDAGATSTAPGTKPAVVRRDANAPKIAPLPPPVLRERLTARARWVKVLKTKGKVVPEHPPAWAVSAIHARGTWRGVRWLAGVCEAPVLRADGSVLEQPGYDPASGLLFEPSGPFLPVPAAPTQVEAFKAAELLLELVGDFPFKSEMHRSAWLAALLTSLGRYAIDGPVPLFLIDSNTRGSGKGLLADVAAVIASGRCTPRMAAADRDEEWRKRIMSIAIAGDAVVLLDNLPGVLGSPALDMALTSRTITDRVMGVMEQATVHISTIFLATGCNVMLKGDLGRRVLHIRLESQHEKPEERADFKQADLLSHVRARRPELLCAALTILRAYFGAGQPNQGLKPWGSFEAWSRLIRNAIVWLGLDDPFATREHLTQVADTEAGLLAALLSAWEEHLGDKPHTLRTILKGFEKEAEYARMMKKSQEQPPLFDVFLELSPAQNGVFDLKRVGNALRKFRGRVVNGKSLECKTDRTGVAEWKLVNADSSNIEPESKSLNSLAGSAGSAGSLYTGRRSDFQKVPSNGVLPFGDGRPATQQDPADPADLSPASGDKAGQP